MGLILGLWWVYYLVPHGQTLHQQRQHAFSWGYGHVLLFGSLAALGAFIGVVADGLRVGAPAAVGVQVVSPVLAIGLVAAARAIYLCTVWWMSAYLLRARVVPTAVWLTVLAWLAGTVAAVQMGLGLASAHLLVALAPAAVVGHAATSTSR